jgi:hypothetical protein
MAPQSRKQKTSVRQLAMKTRFQVERVPFPVKLALHVNLVPWLNAVLEPSLGWPLGTGELALQIGALRSFCGRRRARQPRLQ